MENLKKEHQSDILLIDNKTHRCIDSNMIIGRYCHCLQGSNILPFFGSRIFILFIGFLFLLSFCVSLIGSKVCYNKTPIILSSSFPFLFPSLITGLFCIYWLYYLFTPNRSVKLRFLYGDTVSGIRIRTLNQCNFNEPIKVDAIKIDHQDPETVDTNNRLTAQFEAVAGEGQLLNLQNLKEYKQLPMDCSIIHLIFSTLTVNHYDAKEQQRNLINLAFQYTFASALITTL